jgi:hypothetical protein
MDVVCCGIRVVSEPRRTTKEKMRNQADRKRYLIGLLGERGKAKKKKVKYLENGFSEILEIW